MLRLPSFDAAWVDMPRGVRVLHKPATDDVRRVVLSWARQEAERAVAAKRDLLPGWQPAEQEEVNLRWGFVVAGFARLCITDWTGVDAPFSPDAAAQLMQLDDMAAAYLELVLAPLRALDEEGNVYAPAPNGTTAGALITAGPVSDPESVAAPA